MPTWTVQTRSGVRRGLTLYQLEALMGSGRLDAADPARCDDEAGERWTRLDEIPALSRRLRAQSSPAPVLDDATVFALLRSSSDARPIRRLVRVTGVLKVGAALLLGVEFVLGAWMLLGR